MVTRLTLAVMLSTLLLSCDKETIAPEYLEAIDARLEWNEARQQNGNNYTYTAVTTSFSNTGTSTEIRVEDGIVTYRRYEAYSLVAGQKDVTDTYEETGADIGSNQMGMAPLTIGELYYTCLNEYLRVDPEKNYLYFTTIISGVPGVCGYVPDNCMDDCYLGFNIETFRWD